MTLAKQHHQAGQLADAEKIYRQILREQPNHPEALYFLGVLTNQRGDTDAAIDLIRQSISFRPGYAEAHRNLGVFLAKRGRFDEAFGCFTRAAQLKPDDPVVHGYLAKIFTKRGEWDDALAAYGRVVKLKPDAAEAHYEIGNILGQRGQLNEAVAAFSQAIQIKPDIAMAHFGLGHVYRTAGRLDQAMACYGNALRLKPDLLEAHAGMAIVHAMAHRFEEAMTCHSRTLQLRPDSALGHEVLGWIMLCKNDAAAAVEHFHRAVTVDPNLLSGWDSLGLAMLFQGRFEDAAECFRHILAIQPDNVTAHKNLVNASRRTSDREIAPLLNILSQPNLSVDDRATAELALATALDDAGRFDEAFPHAALANQLVKRQRASLGERFDPSGFHAHIDRLIEIFTPGFFEQRRGWGDPSELPVFVVGMPRSGTTLVQQIAGSHPQVYGAGELNNIFNLADRLVQTDAPRWSPDSIKDAALQHLAFLANLNSEASRIIDKMPGNVLYLGLISVLFPRARVVLCRRDSRDTCLSCFFVSLPPAINLFSYDLADCGLYHREINRLMAHWLRVLPLPMLEVSYEQVVQDLEGQSRRLIDFLGLPWHPACLEFYRAKTTVLTSSVWQVRQPIYQGSVGRWRRYEKHLQPLFEALGE